MVEDPEEMLVLFHYALVSAVEAIAKCPPVTPDRRAIESPQCPFPRAVASIAYTAMNSSFVGESFNGLGSGQDCSLG